MNSQFRSNKLNLSSKWTNTMLPEKIYEMLHLTLSEASPHFWGGQWNFKKLLDLQAPKVYAID